MGIFILELTRMPIYVKRGKQACLSQSEIANPNVEDEPSVFAMFAHLIFSVHFKNIMLVDLV